jgi:hypothetical protein
VVALWLFGPSPDFSFYVLAAIGLIGFFPNGVQAQKMQDRLDVLAGVGPQDPTHEEAELMVW